MNFFLIHKSTIQKCIAVLDKIVTRGLLERELETTQVTSYRYKG